MINKNDFKKIKEELEKADALREEIIGQSRKALKASKQAIYCIHRKEISKAEQLLKEAVKIIKQIRSKANVNTSPNLFSDALQEYAEARCYFEFVSQGRISTSNELEMDIENYLMGICDLTGELERRAVHSVISNDFEHVKVIHSLVEAIYQEFLQFDLRNSELRKKSDSIKWNLKRIEDILYDLKLKGKI